MRLFLSTALAASLLAGPVFAAECTRPADHTAMDVTALKTQLMVMALTCKSEEKYNAFIGRYRPDLNAADKNLAGYFARANGRNSAKARDDYVTQLANSQSQTGLRQGSAYCDHNMALFDEVMALRNNAELNDFAAGKITQESPIVTHDCGPGSERATRTASRTTRRR